MIPGAGQFYSRRIWKGLLFLLLGIGAHNAEHYMLGTTRFLGLLPAIGFYIFGILVFIVAAWDAVHFARKQQALSKETPDPWFGVFLSLIVGLFGYVYWRKWLYCVLWLTLAVLSVFFLFLIQSKLLAYIVLFIFYLSVPTHVYLIANKKHGQMGGKAALLFFVLLYSSIPLVAVNKYLDRYGLWYGRSDSKSMDPTLKVGDRVIVNNSAYVMIAPEVNDIVVIKTSRVTRDPCASESADATQKPILTKRIVAGGGDIIEVNDGMIKVNGKIREYYSYIPSNSDKRTTRRKNLLAQNGQYRVPEGKFFVMGDNIDNSFDSRYFGAVPRDAIIGKVVKVYWPFSRARILK